jgi:hypothetical protein
VRKRNGERGDRTYGLEAADGGVDLVEHATDDETDDEGDDVVGELFVSGRKGKKVSFGFGEAFAAFSASLLAA